MSLVCVVCVCVCVCGERESVCVCVPNVEAAGEVEGRRDGAAPLVPHP